MFRRVNAPYRHLPGDCIEEKREWSRMAQCRHSECDHNNHHNHGELSPTSSARNHRLHGAARPSTEAETAINVQYRTTYQSVHRPAHDRVHRMVDRASTWI